MARKPNRTTLALHYLVAGIISAFIVAVAVWLASLLPDHMIVGPIGIIALGGYVAWLPIMCVHEVAKSGGHNMKR